LADLVFLIMICVGILSATKK